MDADGTHVSEEEVIQAKRRKKTVALKAGGQDRARLALEQCGVSPKVLAGLIAGLITFALTKFAIPADPIVEQAVNVLAALLAAYVAPPGRVLVDDTI